MKLSILSVLFFGTFSLALATTPIEIRIVAFGGKVTIVDDDDKSIAPAKGTVIPVKSTISTGANSWVDLSQGGLSTIRIKAQTEKFTIRKSLFDEKKKRSFSLFKLLKGAVYVRTNKENLTEGSKYEIEMPELISGVVGSEGECATSNAGSTLHNVEGKWTGNGRPVGAGHSMVWAAEIARVVIVQTPPNVQTRLTSTADTMCSTKGTACEGSAVGGTAVGAQPSGSAISPSCEPGAPLGANTGAGAGAPAAVTRPAGDGVASQVAKEAAQSAAQSAAKDIVRDVGRPPPPTGGGSPCPPPAPPPCPPCR